MSRYVKRHTIGLSGSNGWKIAFFFSHLQKPKDHKAPTPLTAEEMQVAKQTWRGLKNLPNDRSRCEYIAFNVFAQRKSTDDIVAVYVTLDPVTKGLTCVICPQVGRIAG